MRFVFVLLLTAVASYGVLLIMPWWTPMLAACCIAFLLPMKNGRSFLATGLGAALCYSIVSLMADQANDHILSRKMAVLFGMPSYSLMIVLTAMTGFITAGLGGWTGAAFHRLFRKQRPSQQEAAAENTL